MKRTPKSFQLWLNIRFKIFYAKIGPIFASWGSISVVGLDLLIGSDGKYVIVIALFILKYDNVPMTYHVINYG